MAEFNFLTRFLHGTQVLVCFWTTLGASAHQIRRYQIIGRHIGLSQRRCLTLTKWLFPIRKRHGCSKVVSSDDQNVKLDRNLLAPLCTDIIEALTAHALQPQHSCGACGCWQRRLQCTVVHWLHKMHIVGICRIV